MTGTDTTPAWHTDQQQVLDFARILAAADAVTTAADALDYFERPHRFDPEHSLWTRSGRPRPPSADDLHAAALLTSTSPLAVALHRQHRATNTAWDAFCELLDALVHTGQPLHATRRH